MVEALKLGTNTGEENINRLKLITTKYVNNVKYNMSQSNITSVMNYDIDIESSIEVTKLIKKYDTAENDAEFDLEEWLNS